MRLPISSTADLKKVSGEGVFGDIFRRLWGQNNKNMEMAQMQDHVTADQA